MIRIEQGNAALDLAAHSTVDKMTGVVSREGYEVHGGLAVPMTQAPVSNGDGIVVISVQGVANPAGAVRMALRLSPMADVVYARSTRAENSVAYELIAGAWCALHPHIGAAMWEVWTPDSFEADAIALAMGERLSETVQ